MNGSVLSIHCQRIYCRRICSPTASRSYIINNDVSKATFVAKHKNIKNVEAFKKVTFQFVTFYRTKNLRENVLHTIFVATAFFMWSKYFRRHRKICMNNILFSINVMHERLQDNKLLTKSIRHCCCQNNFSKTLEHFTVFAQVFRTEKVLYWVILEVARCALLGVDELLSLKLCLSNWPVLIYFVSTWKRWWFIESVKCYEA